MLTIIIVAGGLLLWAMLGLLVLLRMGIGGSKCRGYLSTEAQTRADAATRAITGLYIRMPDPNTQHRGERVPDDPR